MAHRRRLGDFVARAAAEQGLELDPLHPPFDRQASPLLRPNRVPNHVLLYPGSFNPPHRGHQALLDHVLRNAGDDLCLAAAIIIPTDDDKLAAKNSKDEQPFLLSQEKRATLWREAGIPKDRVWVFEGSDAEWRSFRAHLHKSLARDRIDVRFVLLVGPDWINSRAASDPKSWDCVDAITSDVSRPVDFRYPHSLRQLPACSTWKPSSLRHDTQSSELAMDTDGVEGKARELPVLPAVTSWKCETLRKPLRRYHFVPSQLPNLDRSHPPSSTEIRRIIALCQGRQLKEALYNLAISPSLLLRYALEGGPYSAPAIRAKSLDHEARKAKADEQVTW